VKHLAKALHTSDSLRAAAKALAKKGRGNDTMLAHITPREIKLLKQHGGSGTRNPQTGLIEFDDSFALDMSANPQAAFDQAAAAPPPDYNNYGPQQSQQPAQTQQSAPLDTGWQAPTDPGYAGGYNKPAADPTFTAQSDYGGAPKNFAPQFGDPNAVAGTTESPAGSTSPFGKALDYLGNVNSSTYIKALTALGGLGLGVSQQGSARKQANQAATQYNNLASPFLNTGKAALAATNSGALTAQNAQAYQAAQAQAAQGVANTGGVGSQQSAMALGNLYAGLLGNQYNQAMATIAQGNQYAMAGIQAGVQADQQIQSANVNFYSQLARLLQTAG
jgi:hypothetical protein